MPTNARRLGTVEGVVLPTATTILGVILYVRTGWVVGQLGTLGAVAVVLAAFAISAATALSIASIASNVRVGGGGAFALLTRTIGIEPGGSIGVPLYVSQALAIAMYLFGFREGWLWIFPDHPAWAVDGFAFVAVFAIASVSPRFAFRTQYILVAAIAVSLVSVAWAVFAADTWQTVSWTTSEGGSPAEAFAVFFPAVTGILAGVNLSGELATPRRSIARGTLAAILATLVIYLGVVVALTLLVPMETLRDSRTAMVDAAASSPLVLAGLLGATLSSALSTAVGAPRILTALARHEIPPGASSLAVRGLWNQPHRALGVTALIAASGVAVRDLNAIAPLVTLFFLLTYGAINVTLLIQQGLKLPRFRPSFRVPLVVPLLGTAGCAGAMWVVDPVFTVLACICVGILYVWLAGRAEGPIGQVRAGVLVRLFGWIAARTRGLPDRHTWQPRLLVPYRQDEDVQHLLPLVRALTGRVGAIDLLALDPTERVHPDTLQTLRDGGPTVTTSQASTSELGEALHRALGILEGTVLPPNLVVTSIDSERARDEALAGVEGSSTGLWLVETRGEEIERWQRICVWVNESSTHGTEPDGLGLVLLATWRLCEHYGLPARIGVIRSSESTEDTERAVAAWLDRVVERARIPHVQTCTCTHLDDAVAEYPNAAHFIVQRHAVDPDRLASIRRANPSALVLARLSGDVEAD